MAHKADKWIRREPSPPSRPGRIRTRTHKAKNRSSAPQCASAGCASDSVNKRAVRRAARKKGPAMLAWVKGGCK